MVCWCVFNIIHLLLKYCNSLALQRYIAIKLFDLSFHCNCLKEGKQPCSLQFLILPLDSLSDESKCLVLQLNIPLTVLQAPDAEKLSVLVYIHGRGFVFGKIDEQHNTALMVQQSITDGQPTTSASIRYRLGALR